MVRRRSSTICFGAFASWCGMPRISVPASVRPLWLGVSSTWWEPSLPSRRPCLVFWPSSWDWSGPAGRGSCDSVLCCCGKNSKPRDDSNTELPWELLLLPLLPPRRLETAKSRRPPGAVSWTNPSTVSTSRKMDLNDGTARGNRNSPANDAPKRKRRKRRGRETRGASRLCGRAIHPHPPKTISGDFWDETGMDLSLFVLPLYLFPFTPCWKRTNNPKLQKSVCGRQTCCVCGQVSKPTLESF